MQDVPERGDSVAPSDLLALRVGPPRVGDADLPDASARLGEPRRDLRLEAESVARQYEPLHYRRTHGLVARLHVGQVEVGEHVGDECQQAVADRVPEEEHAVIAAQETG